MRRTSLLSMLLLMASSLCSTAQESLMVPKGNARAFDKQTRQQNGSPGKNYWQNTSDYFIKTSVDVANKIVSGEARIVYYNNSPDSLKSIVIRLYQDVFKKGANRNSMVPFDPRDVHDGVNIKSPMVNNTKMEDRLIKRQGTLMFVRLNKALAPKSKVELQISWDFKFPQHTLVRMGTIDSTSLFVAQWYPQVAVYDDVYGWDKRSYNGMSEFYNDFSNFEVEITVPANFMVWATGEPQNIKDVLQPAYFEKFTKASQSDEIAHIITGDDLKKGNITQVNSASGNNTWKFKAINVSDFAFGISDHYLWDVTSVEVDKAAKRRTVVGVAYNEKAMHFDKVCEISRETVRSLSEEMPGIPYPFPYVTVYNGDFGMEYPMITNVGADDDFGMTVYANSHEIAHAYFPFLVGTNETKNGWLDEGLVVYLPEKAQTRIAPDLYIPKQNTAAFSAYAGMEDEPALITPTHYLDPKVYFYLNYAKTEQALRMLEIELGEDVFKKCLLAFIERWKYKHPTPLDYFNTFNDVSNHDLNWFWQAWYYQMGGIPDLSITGAETNGNHLNITIENKGDLPLPTVLSFYNKETLVKTITEPGSRWITGLKSITKTYDLSEPITIIRLGSDIIPDANRRDNEFNVKP